MPHIPVITHDDYDFRYCSFFYNVNENFGRALENDGDDEDCNEEIQQEKFIATSFVLYINITDCGPCQATPRHDRLSPTTTHPPPDLSILTSGSLRLGGK